MFKINLVGELEELYTGLMQLRDTLQIELDPEGIPIHINKSEKDLEATFDGIEGRISYTHKNNFFRMFNLWMMHIQEGQPFSIAETAVFEKTGVMVDNSRNAVLKVEGMKKLLRHMARLGLNVAMLYNEDTYEVKEYPYFGYLRGRYSEAELKEIDDYAFELGIEMVPCIQTLGHLTLALQYEYAQDIRDTRDILLVGEPKTYEFIDTLIETASRPFRSKRIHIGMDEAHDVGLGAYRRKNGFRDQFSIMNEHLKEVVKITEKYDLEPMMWSDMYYRAGSATGDYYDLNPQIPEEIIADIPDVDMVYWDYYHEDEKLYDTYIKNHQKLNKKLIFAGGIWTWNGIAPNYGKTFATTIAALTSCKQNEVKEVFATVWGDDGTETPLMTILPGLQLFAELTYRNEYDEKRMAKEFKFNFGLELEEFLYLNDFDETPGVMEGNLNISSVSKSILWQDPLLGLFDETIRGLNLSEYYRELAKKIKPLAEQEGDLSLLFDFYYHFADVLETKSEMGIRVSDAYHENDKDTLQAVLEQAKQLREKVKQLQAAHRAVWLQEYKVFGWEVMDIRYGGVLSRNETLILLLTEYLNGETDQIMELEEKKLPFSGPESLGEGTLGRGFYSELITTGKISGC